MTLQRPVRAVGSAQRRVRAGKNSTLAIANRVVVE